AALSPAALRALVAAGIARAERRERPPARDVLPPAAPRPTLTAAQRAAVDAVGAALDRAGTTSFLLHGVTGSGKTEAFLAAAEATLTGGGDVVILVPEIALTHQVVERVRARFGEAVAVLHSGLGPSERWAEWRRIRAGAARVVVGARSAVFAPVARL